MVAYSAPSPFDHSSQPILTRWEILAKLSSAGLTSRKKTGLPSSSGGAE